MWSTEASLTVTNKQPVSADRSMRVQMAINGERIRKREKERRKEREERGRGEFLPTATGLEEETTDSCSAWVPL